MSSTYGTSSTQGSMRDTVRDTVKDAKDAVRESAKAVSEAGSNMQPDLDSLRNEVRRLTDQIAEIVTAKGNGGVEPRAIEYRGRGLRCQPRGRKPCMRFARWATPWSMRSRSCEETALHHTCHRGGHRIPVWRHMAPLKARSLQSHCRHGRACHGHPRPSWPRSKSWMAGTSPAMTE